MNFNLALKVLVKSAQNIKIAKAMIVVGHHENEDKFIEALRDYNEFFFTFHDDLSQVLRPLIFDNDMRVSAHGCQLLEECFNTFRTPSTEAEKKASEYCRKYSEIL